MAALRTDMVKNERERVRLKHNGPNNKMLEVAVGIVLRRWASTNAAQGVPSKLSRKFSPWAGMRKGIF